MFSRIGMLDVIGTSYQSHESGVDNQKLIKVNDVIRNHPSSIFYKLGRLVYNIFRWRK